MMQANVGAPVERDGAFRRLDLPQGDDAVAVGNERRRIVRAFADEASAETIAEEAAGAVEISNALSDMIDPARRGSEILGHFESPASSFRDQGYVRAREQSKRSPIAGMDI
jgi:hypothetical protein